MRLRSSVAGQSARVGSGAPLRYRPAAVSRLTAALSTVARFALEHAPDFHAGAVAPEREPRLQLRTLVLLRWLAVVGQGAMLLLARFWLGLDFALGPCLVVTGVSAAVNLVAAGMDEGGRTLTADDAALQLGFDIVQLSGLLALTGGTSNPFILLLLAPVTVGAANLPLRHAAILLGLALVASAPLAATPIPLPWYAGETAQLPPLYLAGAWLALAAGLLFSAGFVWRASEQAGRMATALGEAEAVLESERRLAALGGLAAAAAHELGTPLATIQITAKEMVRAAPPGGDLAEDAALVLSQAERCRRILKSLTAHPETPHERLPLHVFLEEVVAPLRSYGPRITVNVVAGDDSGAPYVRRQPEALRALRAFVENAVDFATAQVRITAGYDRSWLMISVSDDGRGFSQDALHRLGQPYFTTRPQGEGSRTHHAGMGLGFFIAKTLLERTGAAVAYGNLKKGAVIVVRWPREAMEVPAPLE